MWKTTPLIKQNNELTFDHDALEPLYTDMAGQFTFTLAHPSNAEFETRQERISIWKLRRLG
jgi:hypothetical protein